MLMLRSWRNLKVVSSFALKYCQELRQPYQSITFRNAYSLKNRKDASQKGFNDLTPLSSQPQPQVPSESSEQIIFNSTIDMQDRIEYEQKICFFIAIGLLMTFNVVVRLMLKSSKSKRQTSKTS